MHVSRISSENESVCRIVSQTFVLGSGHEAHLHEKFFFGVSIEARALDSRFIVFHAKSLNRFIALGALSKERS